MNAMQVSPDSPAAGKDTLSPAVPENFDAMVAEAAYYLAEQRGFTPGSEVDDWLCAEAQVRDSLEQN
ncbi:MAG: DUF2934 domain-containing protein [Gammaproteobacteria bacterium]|nr:DUF2934 domain-containing protein [Gammaproteobacteria bacterium]MBU1654835.1 DUF2934 domain-containing protein [Gammaproteobacteria bacterium]MBU1961102.1 DUF2934 domain-containing protein [Gammaproteobacteria bacterium]